MELKKQIAALKVFIGNSPIIAVLNRLLARINDVEAQIPLPTDLTPLQVKLGEIEGKVSQGFSQVETELNKAILLAESNGTELDSFAAKNVEDFKSSAKKLEELRTELIGRMHGGGSANRNIQVEGRNVLSPYTDINLVGTTSSILASTDNQNKTTIIRIPTGGGGGGGTPASPDTSIQFNNSGSFGGSKLLYTDPGYILLRPQNQAVDTNGYEVDLVAGDATGNGNGGDMWLGTGFPGTQGSGGNMHIYAGDGSGTGDGGAIFIQSGHSTGESGNGGDVLVQAEGGSNAGRGGNINLKPGYSNNILGTVSIYQHATGLQAIFDTSLLTTSDKTFAFPDTSGTLALQSAVTQDITVLTALPSTFATLHFTNGILTSVT